MRFLLLVIVFNAADVLWVDSLDACLSKQPKELFDLGFCLINNELNILEKISGQFYNLASVSF